MDKEQPRGEGAGSGRRRKSAPGGTKRKLDVNFDDNEVEIVDDGEADGNICRDGNRNEFGTKIRTELTNKTCTPQNFWGMLVLAA